VQLRFVAEAELSQAVPKRGTIEINVLAGLASMIRFDLCRHETACGFFLLQNFCP